MQRAESIPNRRTSKRELRRLACELNIEGDRRSAVVLDLSAQGLFLRTNVTPPPGTVVQVIIRRPGGDVWTIDARVARTPASNPTLPLVSARGLGLAISDAPAGFYEFLAELGG